MSIGRGASCARRGKRGACRESRFLHRGTGVKMPRDLLSEVGMS